MHQDQNPYQSPDISFDHDATAAMEKARLVRWGRLLFIFIFLFYVPLLEIALPLYLRVDPNGIKIGFALTFFFLMWRGHGWAILLTCLYWGLGAIFLAATGFQYLADKIYPSSITLFIIATLHALTVLLFIYSKSLNAFFKHQAARRRGARNDPSDDDRERPSGDHDFVTVATFDNSASANACRYMLEDLGISAFVVDGSTAGFNVPVSSSLATKLQVSRQDAEKAIKLIEQAELPSSDNPDDNDKEDVTFACEECGHELTFPSFWRGHVRSCPHCGKHIDVPE